MRFNLPSTTVKKCFFSILTSYEAKKIVTWRLCFYCNFSFKNGAFTRNRVRKEVGAKTWDDFEALVAETPPGNNGNIGIFFQFCCQILAFVII